MTRTEKAARLVLRIAERRYRDDDLRSRVLVRWSAEFTAELASGRSVSAASKIAWHRAVRSPWRDWTVDRASSGNSAAALLPSADGRGRLVRVPVYCDCLGADDAPYRAACDQVEGLPSREWIRAVQSDRGESVLADL